jgi:hypothetical protein
MKDWIDQNSSFLKISTFFIVLNNFFNITHFCPEGLSFISFYILVVFIMILVFKIIGIFSHSTSIGRKHFIASNCCCRLNNESAGVCVVVISMQHVGSFEAAVGGRGTLLGHPARYVHVLQHIIICSAAFRTHESAPTAILFYHVARIICKSGAYSDWSCRRHRRRRFDIRSSTSAMNIE